MSLFVTQNVQSVLQIKTCTWEDNYWIFLVLENKTMGSPSTQNWYAGFQPETVKRNRKN